MFVNQPVIILIRPQLSENIGMTARAMMNTGLYHLRLVSPKENHLSDKALSASSGAEEILKSAQIYSSTESAIADLTTVYATTARRRNQIKKVYTAEKVMEPINATIQAENSCGIIFGPERTGLENEDISLANAIIEIPLNPKHCSLNLSQAVLLVGYEWYKTQIQALDEMFVTNTTSLATKEELFRFLKFLEDSLVDFKNLQDEEKRPTLLRNLHNIFTRNQMTTQEINTLYGIITHLKK